MGNNTNKPSKRANEDDGNEETCNRVLPYQMYESIRNQRITTFYMTDHVGEPREYTDMVHRIRVAQPQDIIHIHFNTVGGRLDTGVQIINAMKDSQARIIGVLDSKAYSLGTLMFLAADEFVVHENCQFMIHNYSGGTWGKGNEQKAELDATIAWFRKLALKYYVPFLTKEEVEQMLSGKDFWMESDEVRKRLKRMIDIQNEEAQPKPRRRRSDQVVVDGELPAATEVPVPPEGKEVSVTIKTAEAASIPAVADTKSRRTRKAA